MKSERRHELHQNELADWMNRVSGRAKPYANVILAGLLAAVVVGGLYFWWSQQQGTQEAAAWDQVSAALDLERPSELERVAEIYPNAEVGQWAAVLAADQYRARGSQELFRNKAAAAEDLQKARDNFREVLAGATLPAIRERATFGLARTYEALSGTRQSQGELKRAIAEYEKVTQTWPDGVYASLAEQRIDDLNRRQTKVFYDEFARFEPEVAPPLEGERDESGEGPIFEPSALPDDASMPDMTGLLGPADATAGTPSPEDEPPPDPQPPQTPAEEPAP